MNELDLLKRKLEREIQARKQAEQILEAKAVELFKVNESLKKLNESLEDQIKRRTQDLRDSEIKYRNVVDRATDIIYSTDEEGYFTFINPQGCKAFGYSKEEIIGKRYIDFVLEEYKPRLFEYYTRLKQKKVSNDYYEFPIMSKSGEIHWIGQNVNRIEKPHEAFYFNAVARDITLRKKAEVKLEQARQALVQSEVKYRSVLENMELGLMEVDLDGKIVRVYDRFCTMTGYTPEELVGKDAIDIFVVKGYEGVLRKQDNRRLKGQSDVYEVKIKRKDGKPIWVLISGAPFYDINGEVIGSLGIHYDISDRKELEENLEKTKEKAVKAQLAEQQFLANMSHEIRTPLNAIIGMSHLLEDSDLDEKQEEYVEILSNSASLLKGLVADILDISKIDSGMAEMNESSFDLSELIERLIKIFAHRAEERSVRLIGQIDCQQDCLVISDRQWINQILINLLGNAVKFTLEGEIQLTVKKTELKGDSNVYFFEVKDTGIGINQNELGNIFGSFKQANTEMRKEFGGTGLGLSIASNLVALLGGKLEVESKIGEGSRFFFSLNLKSSNSTVLNPVRIGDLGKDTFKQIKILIVEDNLMNQKYILTLLDKWGIDYDLAINGQDAVDKYKLNKYDMIFMDLSMPVMDGYEATRIIRSISKVQVPIIALTASTFLSKKELAMQSGMTDFLAKPFIPEDLALVIQKHSKKSPKSDQQLNLEFTFNKRLNVDVLENIYGTDYSHALSMFQTYKELVLEEISMLFDYIKVENRHEIRKQAHKIKPIFSMVGLSSISLLCEEIEKSANEKGMDLIASLSNDISTKATETLPLIETEIKRLQNIINQGK